MTELQLEQLKALESRIEKLEGGMVATNTKVDQRKVVQLCALKQTSHSCYSDMCLFALMSDGSIWLKNNVSKWHEPWERIPSPGK